MSIHITNNIEWIDVNKEKANLKISVADGNKLDAQLKSTVSIKIRINGAEKISIKSVLCIPLTCKFAVHS